MGGQGDGFDSHTVEISPMTKTMPGLGDERDFMHEIHLIANVFQA